MVSELRKQTAFEQMSALALTRDFALPLIPDPKPFNLKRRQVYQFNRTTDPINISVLELEGDYAYSFSLNAVPGNSEFLALFDEYRIMQIQVNWFPLPITFSSGTSPSIGSNYSAISAIDPNDAAPNSYAQLVEYGTSQQFMTNQGHRRVLSPKSLSASYLTSTSVGSAPVYGKWISTTSSDVDHFGFKLAIAGSGLSTPAVIGQLTFRYVLQFRSTI